METPIPDIMVALDLETTGLHPFFSAIVEVGAIAFETATGAVIAEYSTLVNPEVSIPGAVIAIHGITDRMVVDAPKLPEIFPELTKFLEPHSTFVGHNITFDLGFLRHRAAQLRQHLGPPYYLDTVKLARWAFPGLKSYRLTALSETLELYHPTAHRALADADVSRQLFFRAYQLLQQQSETPGSIFDRSLKVVNGEPLSTHGNITPEAARLYRACEDRQRLMITYANAQQETSRRMIDPLGMQFVGGSHYVVAYCHYKQSNRTFRVDRILHWEVVGEVAA
ncbi:MAG: exonuclease domain-containing protein, partial [bacterium]